MNAITTRNIKVGDYEFHLSTSGTTDKRAILWLHGSGPGVTALTNWQAILEALSDDSYNIAPDIIGFGDSSHPNPPPSDLKAFTELRVETLAMLLDELGVEKADLVGNSMGGIISVCFALAYPQRVHSLILMGAGGAPLPPTDELLSLILFYENPTKEAMAELMTKFVVDQNVLGGDLDAIAAERMPRAIREDVERSHRATFNMTEPLPISPETLATISQPALIVHGDKDKIIPLAHGQWYAKHLPHNRLEVMSETGHWLQIEQRDKFLKLLRAFLTETA